MSSTVPSQLPATIPPKPPLTKTQIIFTPGGSQVIWDNLRRVADNKEYRLYCAYLTAITAIRSAVEIVPTMGKLLLNTATWFVDITRDREDGYIIMRDGFIDVLFCIKTTIALVFFSLFGLFFPEPVFGLLKNMPPKEEKQTPELIKTIAELNSRRLEANKQTVQAEAELKTIQDEIEKKQKTLDAKKAELEEGQTTLGSRTQDEAKALELQTQITEYTSKIERLRLQEISEKSKVTALEGEFEKLQSQFTQGKASNQSALEGIKKQKQRAADELAILQATIEQTNATHAAAQSEYSSLAKSIEEKKAEKAGLTAEISTLESSLSELIEQEGPLKENIKAQRAELSRIQEQIRDAEKEKQLILADLQKKIETKTASVEEVTARLTELERKQTGIAERIGKEQQELGAKQGQTEQLQAQIQGLRTTLDKLQLEEATLRTTTLVQLKLELSSLEQQREAHKTDISAKEAQLRELEDEMTSKTDELGQVARTLDAKRKEEADLRKTLAAISRELSEASNGNATSDMPPSPGNVTKILQGQLQNLGARVAGLQSEETNLTLSVNEKKRHIREGIQKEQELAQISAAHEGNILQLTRKETELKAQLENLRASSLQLSTRETALKAALLEIQSQTREVKESFESSKEQLQNLRREIDTAEATKKEANEALKTLQQRIAAARSTEAEKKGEIEALQQNIGKLKAQFEKDDKQKAELDATLASLKKEQSDLAEQIEASTQELDELQSQLSSQREEFEKEKDDLSASLALKQAELAKIEQTIESKTQAETEVLALQTQITRHNSEIEKLKAQETEAKSKVTALEAQIAQLQPLHDNQKAANESALESLKRQAAAQLDTIQAALEQNRGEQKTAEAQLSSLSERIESQRAKEVQLQSEISRLENLLQTLKAQELQLQEKTAAQRNVLSGIEDQVKQAQEENRLRAANLESELEEKNALAAKALERLVELQREQTNSQKKLDDLNAQCQTIELTNLPALTLNQKDLEVTIASLAQQQTGIKEKIALEQQNLVAIQGQTEKLQAQIQGLRTNLDQLIEQENTLNKETLPTLKSEAQRLESQKAELHTLLSAEQAKLTASQASYSSKQTELEALERSITAKREEQLTLQGAIAQIKQEISRLPIDDQSNEPTDVQQTPTKKKIGAAQRLLETLKTDIPNLTSQRSKLQQDLEEKTDELASAEKQLKRLKDESNEFKVRVDADKYSGSQLALKNVELKEQIQILEGKKSSLEQAMTGLRSESQEKQALITRLTEQLQH